ncbi:STAS domain-containing protein, partial [Candidatus Dependentiae bacterium]|nr:STAS domain-containing protein [Candidatus Dependentiae bacterium]
RILIQYSKKIKELNGEFSITEPSEPVKSVLEMTGLDSIIFNPGNPEKKFSEKAEEKENKGKELETDSFNYQLFQAKTEKPLSGKLEGNADLILSGEKKFCKESLKIKFPKNKFGIGIGAFGQSFDDCKKRFGEYIALNGIAAYLPSDTDNAPDFIISSGNLIPEINALYSFSMTGEFDSLFRFEIKKENNSVVFSDIIKTAVKHSESDITGVVLIAETTGMVGVSLRKSPVISMSETNTIFQYPQIRQNLNFTVEPAFNRCLTITLGIAVKQNNMTLNSFVRKLSDNCGINGHFHSLIFTYQPLSKGKIELEKTVASVFEKQNLLSILHLINDERNITGIGQSEFSRGICWFAPVIVN